MNVEEVISELKRSDREVDMVALDILRALIAFHDVLWLSELPNSILSLHRGVMPYVLTPDLLDKAVRRLENLNLITAEERIRGEIYSRKTYRDLYIRIKAQDIKRILANDEVLREYKIYVSEILRDVLKKD